MTVGEGDSALRISSAYNALSGCPMPRAQPGEFGLLLKEGKDSHGSDTQGLAVLRTETAQKHKAQPLPTGPPVGCLQSGAERPRRRGRRYLE